MDCKLAKNRYYEFPILPKLSSLCSENLTQSNKAYNTKNKTVKMLNIEDMSIKMVKERELEY
jgi:hypothetical protein